MLYLVRHAHSDYGPDEMRPLSSSGRQVAVGVADLLEARGITRLVSSPYTRAIETLQPLADRLGLPIAIEPDLRERRLAAGPLENFERALEATWTDFELAHPGGESSRQAQARVAGAIRRVAAESAGRHVAIGSHGNALALFLHTLDASVDFAFWRALSLPDVYVVETAADRAWTYRRFWRDEG